MKSKLSLAQKLWTTRIIKTYIIMASYISISWSDSLLGVNLIQFQCQLNENTQITSLMFQCSFAGFTVATLLLAAVCNRINVNVIFNVSLFVLALANATIPHQKNVYSLGLCFFTNGFACGIIETASISRILHLWGKKSGVLLQILDCMYGIGAVIGPFASQPFLTEISIQESNAPQSTNSTSNEKILVFTFAKSNVTVTPDDLRIVYPYSIVSGYAIVVLISSLIMFCIESQDSIHPSRERRDRYSTSSSTPQVIANYIHRDTDCKDNGQRFDEKLSSNRIQMRSIEKGAQSAVGQPKDSSSSSLECAKSSFVTYGSVSSENNNQNLPEAGNDLKKFNSNDRIVDNDSLKKDDGTNSNSYVNQNACFDATLATSVDVSPNNSPSPDSEVKTKIDNKSNSSADNFNIYRFSIVMCAAFSYAFTNGMGSIEQSFLTKYVTISHFSLTSSRGAAIEGSSWITHVICGIFSIFLIQRIGLKRTLIFSAMFIGLAHSLLIVTFHTGQEWILWAVVNIMSVGSTAVFGSLVAYMESKFCVTQRESSIYLIPNSLGNMMWPTLIGATIDKFPDVFIISMALCGFLAVILISAIIYLAERFYPKSVRNPQIAT